MVIQIRHRRLGAFDSHTFKTDSVIHGLHLYGGPKGSGAEVGGVQMPSSGGGRPHPRAQRPLRIATPPSFAAPPESANIHFQFSITCHASTLRIATPLKKRVRQGRTGWAVGKRPCPTSEPHVYLKYSPMYCVQQRFIEVWVSTLAGTPHDVALRATEFP